MKIRELDKSKNFLDVDLTDNVGIDKDKKTENIVSGVQKKLAYLVLNGASFAHPGLKFRFSEKDYSDLLKAKMDGNSSFYVDLPFEDKIIRISASDFKLDC